MQSCGNLWSLSQEHTLLSELPALLFAWLLASLLLPALGCDVMCDCGTERLFAFSDCLVFLHWFLPFTIVCLNTALVNDAAIAVPPRLGFLLGARCLPEEKGSLVSLLCRVQEMKYRKK